MKPAKPRVLQERTNLPRPTLAAMSDTEPSSRSSYTAFSTDMPSLPQIYTAFSVDSANSSRLGSPKPSRRPAAPQSTPLTKQEQAARRSLRYAKAEENLARCLRTTWREPTHLQLQLSALQEATSALSRTIVESKEALEKLKALMSDSGRMAATDPEVYRDLQRQRWREERRGEVAEDLLKTLKGYLDQPQHPIFLQTLYPPIVPSSSLPSSSTLKPLNNALDTFNSSRLNSRFSGNEKEASHLKVANLNLPNFLQTPGCRQYRFSKKRYCGPLLGNLPSNSSPSTPRKEGRPNASRTASPLANVLATANKASFSTPPRPSPTPTKPTRSIHKHAKPIPLLLGTQPLPSRSSITRTTAGSALLKNSSTTGYFDPSSSSASSPTSPPLLAFDRKHQTSTYADPLTANNPPPPPNSNSSIHIHSSTTNPSALSIGPDGKPVPHNLHSVLEEGGGGGTKTRNTKRARPNRRPDVEGTGTATIWIDPLWVEREFEVGEDEDEEGQPDVPTERRVEAPYSRSSYVSSRMSMMKSQYSTYRHANGGEEDSDVERVRHRIAEESEDDEGQAPLPEYAVQLLADFASNSRAGRKSLDVRDLTESLQPLGLSSSPPGSRPKRPAAIPVLGPAPTPAPSPTKNKVPKKLDKKRSSLIHFSHSNSSSHQQPASAFSLSPLTAPPRPHYHSSSSSKPHHGKSNSTGPTPPSPSPRKRVSALFSLENISYKLGSGLGAVIPLGRHSHSQSTSGSQNGGFGRRGSMMNVSTGSGLMGPPVLPSPAPLTPMGMSIIGKTARVIIDEEEEPEASGDGEFGLKKNANENQDENEPPRTPPATNIQMPFTPVKSKTKPRLSEASDFSIISIPTSTTSTIGAQDSQPARTSTPPPRTSTHTPPPSTPTSARRPRPTPFAHADALLNRTPVKTAAGMARLSSISSMRLQGSSATTSGNPGAGLGISFGVSGVGSSMTVGGGSSEGGSGMSPSKMGRKLKQRISVLGLRRN